MSRAVDIQGVDALAGEKDRVAGGLGELLDAGGDIDGVTDQGELQFACRRRWFRRSPYRC